MGCLNKIIEYKLRFTETEKKIADYVLENKEEVIHLSAEELGEKVGVSAPSVVRFSRKLDFKGFPMFKLELVKDIKATNECDNRQIIDERDNLDAIEKKYIENNRQTLEKLQNTLDIEVAKDAVEVLNKAKRIYIYGVGASGIIAYDFQNKLLKVKKDARYMPDFHMQLSMLPNVDKEDVVVAISYLGETREINIAIDRVKKIGCKVISITRNSNNTLAKKADINLYVPNEEKEIRLGAIGSRISTLAVTDILYLGLVKENYREINEYIKESYEITNKVRGNIIT